MVKVAEDVEVTECAEATLVECEAEAEVVTGAAIAVREGRLVPIILSRPEFEKSHLR